MCTHLEGPIVLSLLDTALVSWHNAVSPPLPLLKEPVPTFDAEAAFVDNPALAGIDMTKAAHFARKLLHAQDADHARSSTMHPAGATFQRLVVRAVDDYHARQFKKATLDGRSATSKRASMVSTAPSGAGANDSAPRSDPPRLTISTADVPSSGDGFSSSPMALTASAGSDLRNGDAHPTAAKELRNGDAHPSAINGSASPAATALNSAVEPLHRPMSAPAATEEDDDDPNFLSRMSELSQTLSASCSTLAGLTLQTPVCCERPTQRSSTTVRRSSSRPIDSTARTSPSRSLWCVDQLWRSADSVGQSQTARPAGPQRHPRPSGCGMAVRALDVSSG